jgi:hypothetical protein
MLIKIQENLMKIRIYANRLSCSKLNIKNLMCIVSVSIIFLVTLNSGIYVGKS